MSAATGFEKHNPGASNLKIKRETHTHVSPDKVGKEVIVTAELEVEDESKSKLPNQTTDAQNVWLKIESIIMPLVFTGIAFLIRMYKIGANNHVVWDEAHFGKFGSYYLRHEFYHDVHPPLGKMLVGLSGYLANYNGSFDFESGQQYPDYLDYVRMRLFNAFFSVLCVPLAYFSAKGVGFSIPTVWLFTVMVLFENSYSTLGRFILLDSMLLFFTVGSFFSFIRFHNERQKPFQRKWWKWLLVTGIALGCTISVKMVGLFIITVVGIYTVLDLYMLTANKEVSWKAYMCHWMARIVCLIIIPIAIFMFSFKLHFDLLTNSGTGDSNMPSLFQAGLHGSTVGEGPRDVALGNSVIFIKNQGLGGTLLHSHVQTYPEGSNQQQVTCYGHSDDNNGWIIKRARGQEPWTEEEDMEFIRDGSVYRIFHRMTGRNLHSHQIPAPMSSDQWEVACYGDDEIGDEKDNWVIEVMDQQGDEDVNLIHPLTTSFRIRHEVLGCYLTQTGKSLPQWGFKQSEVACVKNTFKRDKRTWWNVEKHENEKLPDKPEDFVFPRLSFLKNFIHLNLAMMATNNALTPEEDKYDYLTSSAWEWPILHSGIRLCSWGDEVPKYFMLFTPVSTWASSLAVLILGIVIVVLLLRWQRQYDDFKDKNEWNLFMMGGFYPLLAWALHFIPFCVMGRVTYIHHYMPALYFAMFVLSYVVEAATIKWTHSKFGSIIRIFIIGTLMASVIACFWYFMPISFGMTGPSRDYDYLAWFKGWNIS